MPSPSSHVSIALLGIGGYGNSYLSALLDEPPRPGVQLVAVVDPSPISCVYLQQLHDRNIPIYSSMDQMLARHRPQLVIVCTPLHLHATQTIAALDAGCHVLCEKPLCGTPAQASDMIAARQRNGRQVSIGYQWSFSEAISELKRDIASGLFGKPRRLKTVVLWPRDEAYYRRNAWAGRRYSSAGSPVFDSPINNACAHHLHNMLYVLDDGPATVAAELYRVNDIETFDTAAVRITTDNNVEILYTASHATQNVHGPTFSFEFENAIVSFHGEQPTEQTRDGADMIARFNDGRIKNYGSPERAPQRKLWAAIESARTNTPTVCGVEAALPHTLLVAAIERAFKPVVFPPRLRKVEGINGKVRRWVPGLEEALLQGYAANALPSEMSVPWAVAASTAAVISPPVKTRDHTLAGAGVAPVAI